LGHGLLVPKGNEERREQAAYLFGGSDLTAEPHPEVGIRS
jgi:hypothetical protein